ncbi:hypothetical protein Q1695_013391 [Nippostrongylus brasiliensis]|nr:hypothetical protein Q1695_013391 [Nippostrongylus brasiliensis]
MLLSCLAVVAGLSQTLVAEPSLSANPTDVVLEINESTFIDFHSNVNLTSDVTLYFNHSQYYDNADRTTLSRSTGRGELQLTARKPISLTFLEPTSCSNSPPANETKCQLNVTDAFVRVTVIKSHAIWLATVIVGWMYFFAWSLSFYPQIFLNYRRKSVSGLNFDFLLLNVIGFSAYSLYNLLMFYDPKVQEEYKQQHPRSPIPVLLNDVVFAVHAFVACVVTGAQCFFYDRDNQRVSKTCFVLASLLVLFAGLSGIAGLLQYINILEFIMCFSYIKMAVTLSKYFPQMYFNFRRKSTVGWSIGNVLLDFTGGTLDILQMVLQCTNVSDWVAFYGNPVKFGLGLVSIVFDIIFMLQHYVLYRGVHVVHAEYEGFENEAAPQSPTAPPDQGTVDHSAQQPILDD